MNSACASLRRVDREKAASQELPAFEKRLRQLSYSPRAIAYRSGQWRVREPWPRRSTHSSRQTTSRIAKGSHETEFGRL